MTNLIAPALYVYAVVMDGAAVPRCMETILPGADLLFVTQFSPGEPVAVGAPSSFEGHPNLPHARCSAAGSRAPSPEDGAALYATRSGAPLAALVSPVPCALFAPDNPASRAADPDWIAARAAAHHDVVAGLADCAACLPLGFGSLFSSADAVRQWLGANQDRLRAALDEVGACVEWSLAVIEDEAAHQDWVQGNDPDLAALSGRAQVATPGTAFLLERRLERAKTDARATHLAGTSARIAERLAGFPLRSRAEAHDVWSLLTPTGSNLNALLEPLADGLAGTGLALRIAGPFPPYAFARAAFQACAHA